MGSTYSRISAETVSKIYNLFNSCLVLAISPSELKSKGVFFLEPPFAPTFNTHTDLVCEHRESAMSIFCWGVTMINNHLISGSNPGALDTGLKAAPAF